jgi:hypothetical protein
MTSRYSSLTGPRSLYEACKTWNSFSSHPTPTPKVKRPPESTSIQASILACTMGLRYGRMITVIPNLIVFVAAATYDRSV